MLRLLPFLFLLFLTACPDVDPSETTNNEFNGAANAQSVDAQMLTGNYWCIQNFEKQLYKKVTFSEGTSSMIVTIFHAPNNDIGRRQQVGKFSGEWNLVGSSFKTRTFKGTSAEVPVFFRRTASGDRSTIEMVIQSIDFIGSERGGEHSANDSVVDNTVYTACGRKD